jgi:hypothetical protein
MYQAQATAPLLLLLLLLLLLAATTQQLRSNKSDKITSFKEYMVQATAPPAAALPYFAPTPHCQPRGCLYNHLNEHTNKLQS